MALDFIRKDNQEHVFALDDKKYNNLDNILVEYQHWTGHHIEQYSDSVLTAANQKTIIKIIDNYIEKTNLNLDKQKTIDIIEFRTFMKIFSDRDLDIEILGD